MFITFHYYLILFISIYYIWLWPALTCHDKIKQWKHMLIHAVTCCGGEICWQSSGVIALLPPTWCNVHAVLLAWYGMVNWCKWDWMGWVEFDKMDAVKVQMFNHVMTKWDTIWNAFQCFRMHSNTNLLAVLFRWPILILILLTVGLWQLRCSLATDVGGSVNWIELVSPMSSEFILCPCRSMQNYADICSIMQLYAAYDNNW